MMKFYSNKLIAIILLSGILLGGCDGSSEEEVNPYGEIQSRLESSEFRFSRGHEQFSDFLEAASFDLDYSQLQYDVEMHRVEYTTVYKGEEIIASGIVFLPRETDGPVPVLSFQHGTIAANAEAPSELSNSDFQYILYGSLAATGVVTVVPDFIGFGVSTELMHPYYVEKPSADAVLDNVRAAAELAIQLEIEVSEELYLAGYSQGGYMTMAAHKSIEENGFEFFELQASFPASGGYDIINVRDFFFEQEVYNQPFFLAYVAEAYRSYYDEGEDFLGLIFQEPYASEIPSYFDGSNSGGDINRFLSDTLANFVVGEYLTNTDASKFDRVNSKMLENSLLDWSPTVPIFMYHGDADVTVPYRSSVTTYEELIGNGTSTNTISLTDLPGASHGSGVVPYVEDFFNKLSELRGVAAN